ncbi:MAG: transposase, partial [Parasutterella sp.]|uniref:transposase n=1 Tax=Parasutterella sp. TaxID=2049037 RepID=UPI00257D88D7
MTHFTISEPLLLYTFPLEAKEQKKLDAFLLLLEKSGAWKYLNEVRLDSELGRPQINKFRLFSAIVYCFALGKSSLREIEAACYYDLRVVYLIGEDRPSSSTISRFISLLEEEFAISLDTVFLDGSKFEANSNKYKFVWKPTTFHLRLSEKALNLLRLMHLSDDVPKEGIISSKLLTEKLTESQKIDPELIEGGETALNKMRSQLYEYLIKSVEYEEKEAICGPDRNSYYKTDHDATAMCLKEDYYSGLGS